MRTWIAAIPLALVLTNNAPVRAAAALDVDCTVLDAKLAPGIPEWANEEIERPQRYLVVDNSLVSFKRDYAAIRAEEKRGGPYSNPPDVVDHDQAWETIVNDPNHLIASAEEFSYANPPLVVELVTIILDKKTGEFTRVHHFLPIADPERKVPSDPVEAELSHHMHAAVATGTCSPHKP